MNNLRQFTGIYPVSKTLRFELKPVLLDGQTVNDFWDIYLNGSTDNDLHKLYLHDKRRNDYYPIMKVILDQFHKKFIALALEQFEVGDKGVTWESLALAYQEDKKSKTFQRLQEEMRGKIRKAFTEHEWWSYISSYSKLIGSLIKQKVEDDDDFVESIQESNPKMSLDRDKMLQAIETFNNFSVYFGNYRDNRNNMYSDKDQATSVANRIVNENYPKFLDNIVVYNRLKDTCNNELKAIESNLSKVLNGISLDDVFTPKYYNRCLTQNGIETYNWVLGGSPNEGVLGINSVGNEYLHHHPDSQLKLRSLKMTQLHKQILSDRVRISFLPEQFNSDEELMQNVSAFFEAFESSKLFVHIQETLNILKDSDTDLNKIYVLGKNLSRLSTLLYGKWDVLGEKLRSVMVTGNTKKAQKDKDKEIEAWLENKCFSLAQIKAVENELMELSTRPLSLMELLTNLTIWKYDSENKIWSKKSLPKLCMDARITEFNVLMDKYKQGKLTIKTDAAKEVLKSVLELYMELFHVIELLRLGNKSPYLEKDDFYIPYEHLFESTDDTVLVSHIVPLYMKVQSYLTRKLADEEKMLLKFDSPTLADGWDANKESANNATILIKDGKYFLMVVNPYNKPNISDGLCETGNYQKIVYHQIADASTDIPNLMVENGITVRKTGRKDPDSINRRLEAEKDRLLPPEINRIRKSGSYLKSSIAFNKEDSQIYLAYYMQRIIEYKGKEIEFSFKRPDEYGCYQDFIDDVSKQKYSLSLIPFSEYVVEDWRQNGKVVLFEITNKDFRDKSSGTANLHTLYWKELFSKQNLKEPVFKLNGEAELFFREKTNSMTCVHKKGSILVNKTFSDGTPIDAELYKKLLRHFNGLDVDLKPEEVNLLPMVRTKKAQFDLMKDKRYYEHKFFLHVPITINFKASATSQKQFNERTLNILRDSKEGLNIIGIDRGERNLIYVSVINQRGENLIAPRHFNLIETRTYDGKERKFDYLTKLKQTEKNRDEARKNWTTQEKIKDLKSGYLSQVVHEIAKLVVRYNAVIVLEDLNFGFKRGRFNVERQVYQNFEKMLIQKLNYLAFKKDAPSMDYGTIQSGLQLTAPFTSFKELGKQSGWLFYVPAGYTSKIDPSTGFVNLFNMDKPADSLREFFGAFDEITYRDGLFYFTFDYSKDVFFKVRTDFKNKWTLASHGERIVGKEKERKDLTAQFVKFFEEEANVPLEKVSVQTASSLDESQLKTLWGLFKLLLKMRNSNDDTDFIISPVASDHPFITGKDNSMQIADADANGAYCIALKGLYWLYNDFPAEHGYLKYIKDEDWFRFIQTKPYRQD